MGHREGIALVLVLLGPSATHGQEPETVRRTGALVALTCHGGSGALADDALSVAEAVWPIVATAFGVPDAKPERPLDVHLYRTVEAYIAADLKLTGGKFRRNLAMSHWDSRSAHVAVQPPCGDGTLRALGLPPLTVAMLAWETTHLARYELCPNYRDHPGWFADGLAGSVAEQVLRSRHPAAPETTPYWANDMARMQRLLKERKVPPARSLFAGADLDLDLEDRYVTRVLFYSFLASEGNREKLAKVIDRIRRTGGGEGYAKTVLDEAAAAFGGADEAFAKFVEGLRPEWEEVYRSLWTAGAEWPQLAFPDSNAIAWRREPLASNTLSAKGSLRILPGDGQQMNFLFGRTDDGFYSIAFVADYGFTVFDYRSKTEEWVRLGGAAVAGLRLGVSTDFEIEAKGTKLKVTLDGKSFEFDLPRPLPERIVWGLGAQAGSAGLWQRTTVK